MVPEMVMLKGIAGRKMPSYSLKSRHIGVSAQPYLVSERNERGER
jgi:hypothetical protein